MKQILYISFIFLCLEVNSQNSNIIIENSDVDLLTLRVSMPTTQFIDFYDSLGVNYKLIDYKNGAEQKPTFPKLPILSYNVLIPSGKELSISVETGICLTYPNVNILPQVSTSIDSLSNTQSYIKNDSIYTTNNLFPGNFYYVKSIGRMRGQKIAFVQIFPYQYNPVTKMLYFYPNLRVFFNFNGSYVAQQSNFYNPDFFNYLESVSINANEIISLCDTSKNVNSFKEDRTIGCDFLIIVYDEFIEAANILSTWKNSLGIRTMVVTTSQINDNYNNLDYISKRNVIKDYINTSQNWTIMPLYLMLLGDHTCIPTWNQDWSTKVPWDPVDENDVSGIYTDFFYADYESDYNYPPSTSYNSDQVPDLFYGRIPVHPYIGESQCPTINLMPQERAISIVNKIINYEKKQFSEGFYNRVAVSSTFFPTDFCIQKNREECRYVKTCEEAASYLNDNCNYNISRLYNWSPIINLQAHYPMYWTLNQRFIFENDDVNASCSTLNQLPSSLIYPNYNWQDHISTGCNDMSITSLFNDNSKVPFLFLYRGHGGNDLLSWINPYLNFNLCGDQIENEAPSIIWSIACYTGGFYTSNCYPYYESLAETWINKCNLGASGIISATTPTSTPLNDRMTWGLLDAVWPDFIEYTNNQSGYDHSPIYQLGAILQFSQDYVKTKYADINYTFRHRQKYHYFGDPTMRIFPYNCKQEIMLNNITVTLNENRPEDISSGSILVSELGDFIIEGNSYSGGSCSFIAGRNIKLFSGFHAQSGSHFIAQIDLCEEENLLKEVINNYENDYDYNVNENEIPSNISQVSNNTYLIMPNPCKGKFEVLSKNENKQKVTIELYDIFGKELLNEENVILPFEVIVSNIPPGIYSVKISNVNEINSYKIVFE